ncbi:MAG: alpha/beta hydrolase [Chloroflexota bacterium]|nr:alpha/beta hydrolase [Chloroflexota bacterium]
MKYTEGRFSGHKNLSLYYQRWLPEKDPEAVLLIVHGVCEHSGRYTNLVDYFVPKGYAVCSFDHRGHGKSEGLQGYVERFLDYVIDLKTFFDIVCGEHSDIKILLVGHSMGGTIATAYAVHHQHELAGLILSGAHLKAGSSSPASPTAAVMARVLSSVLPKVGGPVLDASAISQDEAVVDAYVNDPLVYHGRLRVRLGAELNKTMQKLPSQVVEINLPILIMHGTADHIADPKGSQMLYERVGSKDKTLKLYERFYHNIFDEPGHKQVFADMETWLATRI